MPCGLFACAAATICLEISFFFPQSGLSEMGVSFGQVQHICKYNHLLTLESYCLAFSHYFYLQQNQASSGFFFSFYENRCSFLPPHQSHAWCHSKVYYFVSSLCNQLSWGFYFIFFMPCASVCALADGWSSGGRSGGGGGVLVSMPAKVTKKKTKKPPQKTRWNITAKIGSSLQQPDFARENRWRDTPQQNQHIPRPSSIDMFIKHSMLSSIFVLRGHGSLVTPCCLTARPRHSWLFYI